MAKRFEGKVAIVTAGAKERDVLTVIGDLREENVQKELVDRTVEKFGKLDILIHNAGGAAPDMTPRQGFQMTINDYDYIMELNLRAIVSLTNLAREHLIKSKGEIVVVSSIAALPYGNSKMPYYAMSKAGLDQYMRALAVEMIEHGVRVNGVNPGIVRTTIIHKQGVTSEVMEQAEQFILSDKDFLPSRTIGLPEDIAKAIAFLADRNSSSYIIGHSLVIDGGSNLINTLISLIQMDFSKP
ncbi:hypothetical protein WR25_13010 [Diploscapter pachys]|uniref:Uncharacterized protein n=1 Tax=Diploscapter pachys TaxID=2018661 RepID=A0A2A2L1F0_9BILA|nr:hypothetical protein WR25_13010 [Diploscapter pachys]